MDQDELERLRKRLKPIGSFAELPSVPEEHREKLELLTSGELLRCFREANTDRYNHIHKHHPRERLQLSVDTMFHGVLKKLAEPSSRAEAVRMRAFGIPVESKDMGPQVEPEDVLKACRWAASRAVTKYWLHATEGHTTPEESEEEYLGRLVERVRGQDLG